MGGDKLGEVHVLHILHGSLAEDRLGVVEVLERMLELDLSSAHMPWVPRVLLLVDSIRREVSLLLRRASLVVSPHPATSHLLPVLLPSPFVLVTPTLLPSFALPPRPSLGPHLVQLCHAAPAKLLLELVHFALKPRRSVLKATIPALLEPKVVLQVVNLRAQRAVVSASVLLPRVATTIEHKVALFVLNHSRLLSDSTALHPSQRTFAPAVPVVLSLAQHRVTSMFGLKAPVALAALLKVTALIGSTAIP
mmetsp:Transcript_34738/g.78453  ORF Transcript_34738/g.78453 Transcript_34738/m.78453 type:complete len:250 (-) Transcript_34738:643-1392(-)